MICKQLGTKEWEVLAETDMSLVVTSYPWPALAHGSSRMVPLRQQEPLHKLPDLCLQSLAGSLSAKCIYVFGTHAVTHKQVLPCQLKTTLC